MCFSAEASFAASGVLAASAFAIARIPKKRNEIPLALFPAIFSAHQFIEGILWLNHSGVLSGGYNKNAVYCYIFIAFILWPVYVPFAAYMVEPSRIRRRVILVCQLAGVYVSAALILSIIHNTVDVSIVGHSFSYSLGDTPDIGIPYFVSVSVPLFVLSDKRLILFGIGLMIACGAAALVSVTSTFPSVWCFFAALLTLGLYIYFKQKTRSVTEQVCSHRLSRNCKSENAHIDRT